MVGITHQNLLEARYLFLASRTPQASGSQELIFDHVQNFIDESDLLVSQMKPILPQFQQPVFLLYLGMFCLLLSCLFLLHSILANLPDVGTVARILLFALEDNLLNVNFNLVVIIFPRLFVKEGNEGKIGSSQYSIHF